MFGPGVRAWCSGLVFGIDETLERRRGRRINAKGIHRDGVRSSGSHFVKASGLRRTSLTWLTATAIPWAGRTWALPFLTALAPSERYCRRKGRTPKKLTGSSPTGPVRLSASSYAVLELLHFCQSLGQPVTVITRLRLDAALYEPAAPRRPGRNGRPRVKGKRLPKLRELPDSPDTCWAEAPAAWYDGAARTVEFASQTALRRHSGKPPAPIRWALIRDPLGQFRPQALLSAGLAATRTQVVEWFVLRWQLEAAIQEVRAHLGVETQRRWSDRAIARTTPVLMGLFSRITLASRLLQKQRPMIRRTAAWCAKPAPAFVDTIARVRRHLRPAS